MARLTLKIIDGTPVAFGDFGKNPATGKRWRLRQSFPDMSEQEAHRAAEQWFELTKRGLESGTLWTVGEMLTRYIDERVSRRDWAHNTEKSYRMYARRYAEPISRLHVPDVTTQALNRLFRQLLDKGAKGGEPLSTNTVSKFRWFLKEAFEWFVDENLIDRNPVAKTMSMHVDKREMEALDPDSYAKVKRWLQEALKAEPTDTYGIKRRNCAFAIWLALVTGIREGEACAIRRRDIRLRGVEKTLSVNGGVVIVNHKPERQDKTKGKKSRSITLTERNVETIREHMRWQESYLATVSLNTPLLTLDGTFMRPNALADEFKRCVRETGIPRAYHFHTLRHTHATYLLEDGIDAKTVQERMGHARAETTLDNYGHVMPGRDMGAAMAFESAWDDA